MSSSERSKTIARVVLEQGVGMCRDAGYSKKDMISYINTIYSSIEVKRKITQSISDFVDEKYYGLKVYDGKSK